MYDVEAVRRDFPDPLARGPRPAAGLSRQRRLGAEAAGGDRRGDQGLFARIRQRPPRAALSLLGRDREATRRRAASCSASSARRDEEEIVFTTGSTMAINMVSYAWAAPRLEAGDEIVLSVMEHHANIVPWHFLRERQGVVLKWVDIEPDGSLDPEKVLDAIGPRTKLVAVTHMSNVLGTIVDVKAICAGAHALGVPVLVDGSQAAVHMPVDVARPRLSTSTRSPATSSMARPARGRSTPSASGWSEMRPFLGGGDMIREVRKDGDHLRRPAAALRGGHARRSSRRSASAWRSTT